jgi:hypothetical protein
MVMGLSEIEKEGVYDTCIITKHRRTPFPTKSKYIAESALDLVHGDLYGSITSATPGGRRFFLLLVDDATRFMWISLISAKSSAKSDVAAAIKQVKAEAEKEIGRPLRVLRIDNGGEFTAKEFAAYCVDE